MSQPSIFSPFNTPRVEKSKSNDSKSLLEFFDSQILRIVARSASLCAGEQIAKPEGNKQ